MYLCVCMFVHVGGAPLQGIQSLSTQNVSMDITTFINLNPAVITVWNIIMADADLAGLLTEVVLLQSWA